MTKALILSCCRRTGLSVLAGLALSLQTPLTAAHSLIHAQKNKTVVEQGKSRGLLLEQRAQVTYDAYILGPGDRIQIELLDLPELGGEFTIGPDGTIHLPRLQALLVEGLTIEELKLFLREQFRPYIRQPEVFITPIGYRPVRVYVGGEVARPGYYTIRGSELAQDLNLSTHKQRFDVRNSGSIRARPLQMSTFNPSTSASGRLSQQNEPLPAPTLFDALQAARGVTPFSQLDKVRIIRKRPISEGGGKVQARVNFLRFISDGDEEVNIRLYDDDAIFVLKSQDVLRDQLLAASRTNLSPDFVEVYVSGRVKEPGPQQLPQGASLNQAIASAGGPDLLRGRVEFLRFTQEGATDRRIFAYNPKAKSGNYSNPVLVPGDVVRVNESLLSASLELITEITAPAVGIYSVYSIFKDSQ